LITLLIFYLLFLKIDVNKLIFTLKSVNIHYLVLTIFISIFFNIILSGYKIKKILEIFKPNFSYLEALFLRLGTGPLKFVLPSNSGELLIAFYLKKNYKLKLRLGILSFIINKSYSIFVIWILILFGLMFYELKIAILLLISTSLGLFIIYRLRIFVYKFLKKIFDFIKRVSPKYLIFLAFISLIIAFSELVNVYILFKVLNINIPLTLILLFVPLSMLISKIPITILGLGTREVTIIFFFSGYASFEVLLSIGLLISFVEHIIPAGLGIFFINKFLSKTF